MPYKFSFLAGGLLVGILSALFLGHWPPTEVLPILLLISLSLLKRQYFFTGATIFGYCWLLFFLAWRMEAAPSTLPAAQQTTQFTGQITKTYPQAIQLGAIRLNWYAKNQQGEEQIRPQQGEFWQLEARLRPLRSLQNFGQADSTGRKLAAGQLAGGYVPRKATNKKIKEANSLNQWRNKLVSLAEKQPEAKQRGWRFLAALGLGAKQALTQEDWQVLQATGTLHLWVVSGLHLGLLAGLVLWLAAKYHWPQALALPLAASFALGYAHLAGWGLAAERSALMLLLGLLLISGWRKLGNWLAFSLALLILLLINPLIVLSKGFWLSFAAVAILITGFSGRIAGKGLLTLIKVQFLLLLAFTPFLVWQGGWFTLISLPVNLILVPLVGLFLLPATLIALVFSSLNFYLPLEVLASLFNLVAKGLEQATQFKQLSSANLYQPAYLWLGLLALLPPGIHLRHLAWLGLLLAFLPQTTHSEKDGWQVRVLDVGQGTAILVESHFAGKTERLLYDTGRSYRSGWATVIPALEPWLTPGKAPEGINQLVISHDDQDHSGGLSAIKKHWQVQQEYSAQRKNCYAGQNWQLGQLQVIALWPPKPPLSTNKVRATNQDSCVLLIKAPEYKGKITSLLLTGDADLTAEAFYSQALPQLLTNQQGQQQPLTLLITGHHGSKTSTGLPLLQATTPQYAVHTNGWRNSYGHPHISVVQRLRQAQVMQYSTGAHGAVYFDMSKQPIGFKYKKQPLWYGLGYKP